MNKEAISRREFVGIGTAVAGVSLAGWPVRAAPEERVDAKLQASQVRFGIIGVGMQGVTLLRESIALSGVECAGACDLYDGRHVLAREVAGPELPVTRRYQQLLDDRSISCIIAAVPDHWHRRIVIDSVKAGKDVYCEKPMSHAAADGIAM
jgi:predicted dehydrogenase